MTATASRVDIAAVKARHSLAAVVESAGVKLRGRARPAGRLPVPRRGGGQFHGLLRLAAVVLLRLRRGRRRAGFHPADGVGAAQRGAATARRRGGHCPAKGTTRTCRP